MSVLRTIAAGSTPNASRNATSLGWKRSKASRQSVSKMLPIIDLSRMTLYVVMKYSAMELPISKAMNTAFVAPMESRDTAVSTTIIRTNCKPVRTSRFSWPDQVEAWVVETAKEYSGHPNNSRLATANAAMNVEYRQRIKNLGKDRFMQPSMSACLRRGVPADSCRYALPTTRISKPVTPGHGDQPRRAASIVAMSIFFIVIIASNARLAAAGSGSVMESVSARGVICHDRPHLSLHQPHSLSCPPSPTIAFHRRSVSAWSSVATWNENASLCWNTGPPFKPRQGMPITVNSTVSTSPCLPEG